jgi:hypothetical protein
VLVAGVGSPRFGGAPAAVEGAAAVVAGAGAAGRGVGGVGAGAAVVGAAAVCAGAAAAGQPFASTRVPAGVFRQRSRVSLTPSRSASRVTGGAFFCASSGVAAPPATMQTASIAKTRRMTSSPRVIWER